MDIPVSPLGLALANLVVFCAAFVQLSAGLGFALVAVPLLAAIDLGFVPGPSLFVSVFLALFMLGGDRRAIVRREVGVLLPALALGTAGGALLLAIVPKDTLGILFAVVILLAIAITVLVRPVGLSTPSLIGGGFAAGVMGTVSGIHGPPLALLYQAEEIGKTRATLALIFLVGYVISLVALTIANEFGLRGVQLGLVLLPGLLVGIATASRTRRLLPDRLVRAAILVIAGAGAIVLLAKSLG